jgi:hypothetical protein
MRWVCLGKREVSEVVGPLALALPILPHLTPLGSLIQFSPLKVSSGIGVRVSRSCHSQLDNDPILPGTPTRRGRLPLVWGYGTSGISTTYIATPHPVGESDSIQSPQGE